MRVLSNNVVLHMTALRFGQKLNTGSHIDEPELETFQRAMYVPVINECQIRQPI